MNLSSTASAIHFARTYASQNGFELPRITKLDYMEKIRLGEMIRMGRFDRVFYRYGHRFTLCLLEYFVSIEAYELCSAILKVIRNHNLFCDDELKTKI